jgi:hypothetical protein
MTINKLKANVGLLYIVVLAVLSYLVVIPEPIKGILISPTLVLIPILIGSSLLRILRFLSIDYFDYLDIYSKNILNWCLGFLIVAMSSLLLNSLHIFNMHYLTLALFLFLFFSFKQSPKSDFIRISSKDDIKMKYLYITLFLGLILALFITHFSPYPHIYGIDVFAYNGLSLDIVDNNYFRFSTQNLPSFELLNSVIILIFHLSSDSMSIFWASRFITYPLFSGGLYLLFYQLLRNPKLSLLISLIGSALEFYNPPFDMSLFYFTPKILIWLVFPLFLFLICKNTARDNPLSKDNRKLVLILSITALFSALLFFVSFFENSWFLDWTGLMLVILLFFYIVTILLIFKSSDLKYALLLLVINLTLIFIHPAMGLLAMLFILIFLISYSNQNNPTKKVIIIIYGVLFLILVLIISQKLGLISQSPLVFDFYNLKGLYSNQISGVITTDFISRFNLLVSNTPFIILFLAFGGLLFDLFRFKENSTKGSIIFLISLMLLTYFLPVVQIERVFIFMIPFLAYLSAQFFFVILKNIYKNNSVKIITIFLLIVLIVISLFTHILGNINPIISNYKQNYNYSYFTFYDSSEYFIGQLLISKASSDTLLISDPLTQIMMGGLSHLRSMNAISSDKFNAQKGVEQIFISEDPQESYNLTKNILSNITLICYRYEYSPKRCSLQDISDLKSVIIIAPRTLKWVKDFSWNEGEKRETNIIKFYNSTYFTVLYEDKTKNIYLFGVNPEPGVPFRLNSTLVSPANNST